MLAARPSQRFSLLLLEEGEDYVGDWAASVVWPAAVAGNWSGAPSLPGRLRLASKSLFFDPDDTRVPIVRQGTVCGPWAKTANGGITNNAGATFVNSGTTSTATPLNNAGTATNRRDGDRRC